MTKVKFSKKQIAIISAILVVVIAAAVGITFAVYSIKAQTPEVFTIDMYNSENVIVNMASGEDQFTKTLTATVLPSDAPDKTVTWSIEWVEGSGLSDDVSNYFTLTPNGNTVTVKCIKAFKGVQAIVTCTTKVGNFTASCVCKYVGTPVSLSFDKSAYNISKNTVWNVDMVNLDCSNTYTIPIVKTNALGVVGDGYSDYEFTLTYHGSIKVKSVITQDSDGSQKTSMVDPESIGIVEVNGSKRLDIQIGNAYSTPIEVSISGDNLVVELGVPLTSVKSKQYAPGSSCVKTAEYVDGKPIYYTISVKEKNSGTSFSMNVLPISSVSSVSLSATELNF